MADNKSTVKTQAEKVAEAKRDDTIMRHLGEVSRACSRNVDLANTLGPGSMIVSPQKLADDTKFIAILHRAVQDLPPKYRLIIEKEYLSISEKGWYKQYFPRSSYAKAKREAVKLVLDILHIDRF
ncbi:MAG: hypothetical protein MR707_09930 [Galactobacillus timonensis]|jgi:hypothetical protein|uniref:MG284/MPN403 family protein n=1 Tax=Galactobacillus timonensis TaxID=2041840 RepID=UPI000EE8E029|nr:hypothetical protein [Galactobacillus timonensis]MDY5223414.1 hypothetical protein [Lachnospiraceae bacterium]MDY6281631.1 hypothetical protein [Erysipelotrichaceae bacterium]MCI6068519.1 hypothetical protein [Galactobacillus timonensis]MCI6755174.1 hypothetical protein [Galactobacillus timonensis]MDD7087417.1 hypothetical protein [Galactobacillus timonensis]